MHLRERLSGLRPEERFSIYSEYDLVPSSASALAEDPEEERLAELARSHPEGFGRWYATAEHGKVVDAYQAPQDPTQRAS